MTHRPLNTFRDVIGLWPSPRALAEKLGMPLGTVADWKSRDRIFDKHWPKLIAQAEADGFEGVTYARLADIARGRTSASGPEAPASASASE